ncbi:MAG: shikimate kinase, partial [Cytophagales bacterium]|nr:shikimate kinase [Cytophagales bacterium]
INEKGIPFFLDVPEEELFKRLSTQKKGRPLLENKSDEELKEFIGGTLGKRRHFYEKATYIVKGANIRPEELTAKITHQK